MLGSVSGGGAEMMLALGKDKNNRLVNPQTPKHTEHMLQPTCIYGVASPVYQVTQLSREIIKKQEIKRFTELKTNS